MTLWNFMVGAAGVVLFSLTAIAIIALFDKMTD